MRRPRRWRWWGKWVGSATLFTLAGLWLWSGWWAVARVWPTESGYAWVFLRRGRCGVQYWESQFRVRAETSWGRLSDSDRRAGWDWAFDIRHRMRVPGMATTAVYIPLWAPW